MVKKDSEWFYEGQCARLQQMNKRMFILCLILIVITFATNGAWLFYESQFKTVVIKAEQQSDGDSSNYIIGGDFDAGETKGESH